MDEKVIKMIDKHRRMNEIGGILFGIGIGLEIANRIHAVGTLAPLMAVFLVSGFALLVYEQIEWKKEKKRK